jgi:hypothetical protein
MLAVKLFIFRKIMKHRGRRFFSAFYALTMLLFGMVLLASAQQRPLLTEEVDTVPAGSIRISAGVDFIQDAKFPLSGLKGDLTRVGVINLTIGVNTNVEFQVEGTLQNFLAVNSAQNPSPIPLSAPPGSNSANDSGDFTISTKIKLRNETKILPALAFKFGVTLPNSDQARGIGTNQVNAFGKVIIQKKFGRQYSDKQYFANVFANLGLGIMPAPLQGFTQNDVLLYGVGGIFRINKSINFAGEVNGRASTRSGNAPLGTESVSEVRLGTQIKASGLRFDTAAIIGLGRFSPRSGITFGVTYQSPNIFTPAQ